MQAQWAACRFDGEGAAAPRAARLRGVYARRAGGRHACRWRKSSGTPASRCSSSSAGTPQGFANLRAVRAHLAALGAYVRAVPGGERNLPDDGGKLVPLRRPRPADAAAQALKGGDAPFEDEKFSYLALTREPPAHPCRARLLRHAQIARGASCCPSARRMGRTLTVIKRPALEAGQKDPVGRTGLILAVQAEAAQRLAQHVKEDRRDHKGERGVEQAARRLESIVA